MLLCQILVYLFVEYCVHDLTVDFQEVYSTTMPDIAN